MKSILLKSFAGAGLLLFSLTASAQDRSRDEVLTMPTAMRVFKTSTGAAACLTT
jgi:hypothetical protein